MAQAPGRYAQAGAERLLADMGTLDGVLRIDPMPVAGIGVAAVSAAVKRPVAPAARFPGRSSSPDQGTFDRVDVRGAGRRRAATGNR